MSHTAVFGHPLAAVPQQVAASASPTLAAPPSRSTTAQLTAQRAAFAHVMRLPPHGPFAYLSAGTLSSAIARGDAPGFEDDEGAGGDEATETARSTRKRQREAAAPTAPQCLAFFGSQWQLNHLRRWPSFYAAAELRLEHVDAL